MSLENIKNFEEFIRPVLAKKGRELIACKSNNLTSVGDNFASLMLSVNCTVRNKNSTEEELSYVAKLFPPNEHIIKLFNTPITFKQETEFYKTIVPTVAKFQADRGLEVVFDAIPELVAWRWSLDSNTKIDKNAVLLLKNINCDGYINVDKRIGLDLETTKLVLMRLSEFHATVIAIRELDPELYKSNIAPFLHEFKMFDIDKKKDNEFISDDFLRPIKNDPICIAALDTIKAKMEISKTFFELPKNSSKVNRGKFRTLVHCDLWTNNIMIKFDNNKKPIDVKFVDFQMYDENSVASDLIFFLFTSVSLPVLKNRMDELIQYYYDHFMDYLNQLGYKDVEELTFEQLMLEIMQKLSEIEFIHAFHMFSVLYANKDNTKNLEDMKLEDFGRQKVDIPEGQIERSVFLIHECLRRKWL